LSAVNTNSDSSPAPFSSAAGAISTRRGSWLPLSTTLTAPEFHLPDVVTGNTISLDTFAGKTGLLVMFICRHCPYVKHIQDQLAQLGRDYQNQDLGIVAISSNDAEKYPDDSPESLKEMAKELGFTFPLCYDATQAVAKAYQAACTPDFYLFDRERKLVYRGAIRRQPPQERPAHSRHRQRPTCRH